MEVAQGEERVHLNPMAEQAECWIGLPETERENEASV
jgi:hypothetical protein